MKIFISLFFLSTVLSISGYKILVVPFSSGFNSRFLNMLKLADILGTDGHEVTFLVSSTTSKKVTHQTVQVIEFSIPQETTNINDISPGDKKPGWNLFQRINPMLSVEREFCRHIVSDTTLMASLKQAKFDLYLGDIHSACSSMLATYLNTTTMWYLNLPVPGLSDFFYPQFPSFTCQLPGAACISDDMNFLGRVKNFIMKVAINDIIWPMCEKALTPLMQEYHNIDMSVRKFVKGKIIVANMDFLLDSPLPLMPHIFPISGLFMQKPSPLSEDIEKIVTSATNGVILLSFGIYVPEFDSNKAEMLANVFGQLPQTVLWRNAGQKPKNLRPNTHILDWFPQNDLLARPEVKLFITHCGISSVFETAYHGVPVIAMPLHNEQKFHAWKLVNKVKAGVELDYHTLTESQLLDAIKEVLGNPIYRENIRKTADMLNDKVVSPQQQLRHLVNFTIKSGGALHLFHPYAGEMNFFQFYSLDVILLIVTLLLFSVLLLIFSLKSVMKAIKWLCCRNIKHKRS